MIQTIRQFPQIKGLFSSPARKIAIAAVSTGGARAVNMLVAFASVPIALNYLGPERYGLWMAATSLVFMLTSFADGGIANGLITATAKDFENGGCAAVRVIIASAAAMLMPLSVGLVLLVAVVVPFVSWGWVFNLPPGPLPTEAATVVFLVLALTATGFVVNIILKVRTGLQEIPAVSAWDGAAALAALAALLLATRLELSMGWLVAATVGAPLLVKAFGAAYFFYQRKELRPRRSDIRLNRAYELLGSGSVFLFINLAQAIAIQSDQVLIANLVGVGDVATYSVLQRLFSIPLIVVNFVYLAQWPAYAAAASNGEYVWIKKSFIRTLLSIVPFGIALSVMLYAISGPILVIWVGDAVKPTPLLTLGMLAYASIIVLAVYCATLLISLDVRREQIWLSIAIMVVNLPLSIFLIHQIGAAGAIWGTVISYLFCMVIPYAFIIPRILAERVSAAGTEP